MDYKNKEFLELLKSVAPGTEIRKGIDHILDAGTGGLIVLGCNEKVLKLCDGGFCINTPFNPQRIYELAKMDGAIVLNDKMDHIIYANVQLQPDSKIETIESGTRHRTAERVAKETGYKVIAVSQKRKIVTLYKDNFRYTLKHISDIIPEANQAIKTLERFGEVIEKALINLTIMEFEDLVTLFEVTTILQKFTLMLRVAEEIEKYIVELGVEGRLIQTQFDEITGDLRKEIDALIRDYYNDDKGQVDIQVIFEKLREYEEEEIEIEEMAFILGYKKRYETLDQKVVPKGYRLLSRIKRLSAKDMETLVSNFDGLTAIVDAREDELAEVDSISKIKARSIKNEIKRLMITIELEKN